MPCTPNSTIGSHRQRRESSGATCKEGNVGWNLSSMDDGSKDKEEELRRLREENAMLRHRVGEVEGSWRKAVDSAKGFQEAQQRLFQVCTCMPVVVIDGKDFVIRERLEC